MVGCCATTIRNFRPDQPIQRRIFIPTFHFSQVLQVQDISNISIIKVDVEGGELEVIEGLINAIKKFRPIVIIEILPVYNNTNYFRLHRQKKVDEIFNIIDYKLFRIVKNKAGEFVGLKSLHSIGINTELNNCDYLYYPKELAHEIHKQAKINIHCKTRY